MKILRLSLSNLASLAGEQEILFEQTPLAQAGLIAITGKTGAGKSTLLDAMCLALYDEIPRLRGAAGSIKDAGGKDISIKDSKNILRRGTTSGFAELEFIALDAKRYLARWEIRRARNKVDGNLKVDRFVKCLDDGTTLTQRISEVTPLIEKLIGLSFEQFTRAVLLAQSEVGAFLKAKDHERADLLEYLTNSHIFSLISKKSANKYSDVKQQRADLEKQLGNIEILSQEELNDLEQHHQMLKQQLEHLGQTEKVLLNDLKWHKDQHQLYTDTQAKKEVYDVQQDADQKLAAQKQFLVQLDEFQTIRAKFAEQKQTEQQLLDLNQQHQALQPTLEQAKQAQTATSIAVQNIEAQFELWQQQRDSLKPQLAQAAQLDHDIRTRIEQFKTSEHEHQQRLITALQPLQTQVQSKQQQLQTAQHAVKNIQQHLMQHHHWQVFDDTLPSIFQRFEDYRLRALNFKQEYPNYSTTDLSTLHHEQQALSVQLSNWQSQHTNLAELDLQLKKLQQNQKSTQQHLTLFERLEQQLSQLQQLYEQQSDVNQHIQQSKQHVSDLQSKREDASQQVQKAEQHFMHTEQIFATQRLLQNQSVGDLRTQLRPNEACMVCGSHQHPFAEHAELLDQAIQQLQDQQLTQAKQSYEQARLQRQELELQLGRTDSALQQHLQQAERLSQTIQIQQLAADEIIQQQQLNFKSAELSAQMNELKQWIHTSKVHLEQMNAQWIDLDKVRECWQQTHAQTEQLKFALQQRQQLDQLAMPILEKLPTALQQAWQQDPIQQSQLHCVALQERIHLLKQYQQQQQQAESLSQELRQLELKYNLLFEQHQATEIRLTEMKADGLRLREQLKTLMLNHTGKDLKSFADWQQLLEQEQQQLMQSIQQHREQAEISQQHVQTWLLKQQSIQSQIHVNTQTQQQTHLQIQTWQLAHPDFHPLLIEQCLAIDHVQHQQIRQSLAVHQQTLADAKTSWQTLEEHYKKHLQQQPELGFEQVQDQLSLLSTEKQIQQEAFNETDAKLRMNVNHQQTFAKYQYQIEQIKAEEYRWGRIYDLIGHKEGTKFKKIAQEHHLDILVEYANQQLQPLAPRYQLHRIPDSLSLAIIDLDMNSEVRPVLSLSGGETFLVSLALALAIANMASGSMKLESLFIDEGFGTLDPASLHMVMNALDHLQSQGRKVVLISHIQEMHERIPVQIQVKPVGAGASTIKVVG